MGNYTSRANVQSLFRDLEVDAANTVIIESELDDIISEVEAEIDAKLYDFYVVPVTGTESIKILGKIARMKAGHLVKTILEAQEELSDKTQTVQSNLELRADELLNQIIPTWDAKCCEWVDPRMPLTDATRKQVSPVSGSIFNSNTRTPTIKIGGNNW
jgi:hypothetical protein